MKKVFEPVELKNLKLKNRLVRSATWEGLADPDGVLPEETYAIYEELARGGVGGIITGFTSVALNDFYFGGMMRLCDDALIPQYRRLVEIIQREGCPAIAQLALGGVLSLCRRRQIHAGGAGRHDRRGDPYYFRYDIEAQSQHECNKRLL